MIQYKVSIEEEYISVRGNYMCTDDPEQDKKDEDEIISRVNNGDEKAWFCLKVTATLEGFSHSVYLGCCSLAEDDDIEKFALEEGFYDEAKVGLHEELKSTLERVNKALESMSTLL